MPQPRNILGCILLALNSSRQCDSLSSNDNRHIKTSLSHSCLLSRRRSFESIFFNSLAISVTAPSISNGATDEGISAVTDSSIGKTVRRSAIQGARIIDDLDEKWERFSDGLRDQNRCDENTGRRLFDNGFRKDGTRIGNPVLGSLCNPEPLLDFDEQMAARILDLAVISVEAPMGVDLKQTIKETEDLVRPSFERSISSSTDEEDAKRKMFNFALYSKMKAISKAMNNNPARVKKFQIEWGKRMVSELAPVADRRDYSSPFPELKDEFEDYDYDKGRLLDSLGALQASLGRLRKSGLIGYYEISIPYDDYGSVVTVAIDDYVPLGAEMLLSEQNTSVAGPASALIRSVMEKAGIDYTLDVFYLDPSTTKQNIYNPSQLLLSLSNLRKL